jgi:hypothetical protein
MYGEQLTITGKRGSVHYEGKNDDNQKKTNFYIHRLEIEHRQGVIDLRKEKELLNMPNLEAIL